MDGDRFSPELTAIDAVPDYTVTRVFGILNIIFALLAGLMSAYALGMALFMPMMTETMDKANQAVQEAHAKELADLEAKEAAAATDEEKAELSAQRKSLEKSAGKEIPNPLAAMSDPVILRYGFFDGATGLCLNLLMFVSGIGLLRRKDWGRKLALWTAGGKIVRLLILQAVNIAVVIPVQIKGMQAMMEQMNAANPGAQGRGVPDMAGIQGTMFTAWAVVSLLAGCVYPALTLWFLSRPGARAACQESATID